MQYRVLVVEDDALIAMDLEMTLQAEGCKVVGPVGTVREAMRKIKAGNIDCALVDVNLHHETAFPIVDALSEAHVPFVLVTGHSHAAVPKQHRDRPLITKPYSSSQLMRALTAAARLNIGGPVSSH